MGVHRVRLAVLGQHHKVWIQLRTRITVFGLVPLSTLIAGLPAAHFGTYASPTRTFDYVSSFSNDCCGQAGTVLTVGSANNRCRSVHVAFTTNGETYTDGTPADTVELGVVQQAADPVVSGALGPDSIGIMDVRITPGQSWALEDTVTEGRGTVLSFVNGWADCYSRTPWSH
jgi:hypothetical protein